ncbi:MAG: Gfo/Idh/MocA family oxidoreductase [Nanoarchaeota archaeon]|nr:Gfo/Idh/MocA family oxidoreductase [Nanoarchaeota archaeon]
MKLKFGIIGCGRIAKKTMIPALNSSEIAELTMVGSRSLEKAKKYSKEVGCDSYGTYENVLNNKDVEAVYISLPIGLHEEWTIKAAKAGKHVLCEKTLTTSFESTKKMVEVCKENKVRLMEALMFKYHPQHKKVIELIEKDVLGELITFQGLHGSPFFEKDSIRLNKKLGGGALNEMGCYPIGASRMIFNEEPESVYCNFKKDLELGGVDIKADVTLNYPNGKVAFCSASFNAYYRVDYSVWGTKSYLKVNRAYAVPSHMKTTISRSIDDTTTEEIVTGPIDQTKLMIEEFCRVISHEKKNDFEKDLLLQAKVMEAARMSDKENRVVYISEFK